MFHGYEEEIWSGGTQFALSKTSRKKYATNLHKTSSLHVHASVRECKTGVALNGVMDVGLTTTYGLHILLPIC